MESQVQLLDEDRDIRGVIFKGRLDAICRDQVKTHLHQALASSSTTIIVDLQDVLFIDSSGLSALVSGLRVAREQNKDIILAGLNKQSQMVFNLTMMDRVFTIYPSLATALKNI